MRRDTVYMFALTACKTVEKILSQDQEEEHVSCLASFRLSINLKKLKCERTCAAHAQWYSVRARGSQKSRKIVG